MSDKVLLKDRVFKKKIPESYSHPIDSAIKLVTVPEEKYIAYGSSVFKSLKYASDVDLMQTFKTFNTDKVINALREIIKKIQKTKNNYITDIKCGLDERFIIDELGEIKNGKVIKLNKEKVSNKFNQLYQQKLITLQEYNEYNKLLNSNDIKDYLDLVEQIRIKVVQRWTPEEIIKGSKLYYGKTIYLKDAINHKALTKIDMFTVLNNKFTEFTNVLVFLFKGKDGRIQYSAAVDGDEFKNNLKNMTFSLFNDKNPNYLKGFKRIFTLARIYKDTQTLNKIYPLLISDINLLNKGKSDINAILTVMEDYDIPIEVIRINLDEIKTELSNIADFDFNEKKIATTINDIYSGKIKKGDIYKTLKDITKQMQLVINQQTLNYIKLHNIDMKKIAVKYFP